jgi:hypothetical protein
LRKIKLLLHEKFIGIKLEENMKKFKIKNIFFFILLCFLIIWGISITRIEILTLIHGYEFSDSYKENTMLREQKYCKVLQYSKNYACVFYIAEDRSTGDILEFEKKNGEWHFTGNWETVWSTGGSADNIIWPYWWHFFYAHPWLK